MRQLFILVLFFNFCSESFGQNLVPNGDFEEYEECNGELIDPNLAIDWLPFKGTPDYYNTCDTIGPVGVPTNYHGFQPTLSGNGYGGLIAITYNNGREIIATELTQPLEIGSEYYIEFYWSRSMGGGNSECNCANSHLGALLTTQPFHNVLNPITYNNFAHVYDTEILLDSTNWNLISGWVIADSAYTHIALGNFFDLDSVGIDFLNTNTNEQVFSSYYYIENVCVSQDPAYCGLVSSKNDLNKEISIEVFPNPTTDVLNIKTEIPIELITVMDMNGKEVLSSRNQILDVSNLPDGMYILLVQTEVGVQRRKFIKN